MISFCILIKDVPHLDVLVDMIHRNCPCDHEICIGDNSDFRVNRLKAKELSDVYVRITDKEIWRMGIPWAHNRIVAEANSYKIFYIDADEYPVWINPEIEAMYDTSYVLSVYRYDFLTMEEILKIDKEIINMNPFPPQFKCESKITSEGHQERLYNARYAKFEGLCHSGFHVPDHFRGKAPATMLLHNKTVRDAKDINRMRTIIREQYARQNINPNLCSSNTVLGWGKNYKHMFKDFDDFKNNYEEYPYDDL